MNNNSENTTIENTDVEEINVENITAEKKKGQTAKSIAYRNAYIASSVIAVLLFAAFISVACLVFASVCNKNVTWSGGSDVSDVAGSDISDVTEDGITELKIDAPFGDGYLCDLREYEEYINPLKDKRAEFIVLVNENHKLSSKKVPSDLTEVTDKNIVTGDGVYLSLYAAKALEAMYLEMDAQGVNLTDPKTKLKYGVVCGYIPYDVQSGQFEAEVHKIMRGDPSASAKFAEELASASVLRPGTDEHQTGLCIDFSDGGTPGMTFQNTELYLWLKENSWKFGYILRYPDNKTAETGTVFQPWHFRYVGRFHAEQMKKYGLCLEEYSEYINK